MGDVELFRLSTSTPDHTLVHGSAVLYGDAYLHKSFRRGVDLAAGFDIKGLAEADIGKALAASLVAGIDVTGTLAFEAAVPLDLFTAAGIIAKLQAEVGGDVYVAATLTLSRDLLQVQVLRELPSDLAPFITAVLDELDLSAGLWARASFAAEILGQASLTGALFGPQPGFTFDFRYGAALTFGAGTSFQVDVGLQNPDRMVGRLADAAATLLLSKCGINNKQAPLLPGRASDQILAALDPRDLAAAAANTLVPMGLRSIMGVGVSLLEPSATRVEKTLDAVAAGLLDQVRHQLLTAAHDAALNALQAELTSLGLTRLAANLTDVQRGQLAQALDDLANAVENLEGTSVADAAVWLAAFATTLDPLDRVLGFGFIPDYILRPVTKAVAILWSASVVLGRIATLACAPAGSNTDGLFPSTAAQPAAPADVAALARPGGGAVTYADAVGYLLKVADVDRLIVSAIPGFEPVEEWLRRVLGTDASSLLVLLLSDLAAPSSALNSQLVDLLGKVAADAIVNEIVPLLLTPLKAANPKDPAVAVLVDDIAIPALTALPRVVLPALSSGADDDLAVRLRETLSAVALHAVNQAMIPAIRSLLQHALDNGAASLRSAAADEMTQGTASATHNLFGDFRDLFLAPDDIAGVLNLGADTLTDLHDLVLDPSIDVVSAVLDLGLGKDALAALQALATSDAAPPSADINGALDKVRSGAEQTLKVVIPEAGELVKAYFEHFGARLVVVFEDVVQVVYEAVVAVRNELLEDVVALGETPVRPGGPGSSAGEGHRRGRAPARRRAAPVG